MEKSVNGGSQKPWVSILKWSTLGWFGGIYIFIHNAYKCSYLYINLCRYKYVWYMVYIYDYIIRIDMYIFYWHSLSTLHNVQLHWQDFKGAVKAAIDRGEVSPIGSGATKGWKTSVETCSPVDLWETQHRHFDNLWQENSKISYVHKRKHGL